MVNPLAYVAAAVLVLLLAVIGVQTWRVHGLQTDLLHEQLARKTERAAAAEAAASASESARTEEQRRAAAQQEAAHAAQMQITQARADAVAAGDAAGRLRERASRLAARSCSTAGDPVAAASSPADRLADVLGESVDRYRAVAEAADRAVIAGRTCEAAFDALKGNP
jgi:hypothetical protein